MWKKCDKKCFIYTKIMNKCMFPKWNVLKKIFEKILQKFHTNDVSYTLLLRFDTLTFFHSHVSLLFSHCRNFILRLAWSHFLRKNVWSDHDNLLTGVVRHVDTFILVAWLPLSFSSSSLLPFFSFSLITP